LNKTGDVFNPQSAFRNPKLMCRRYALLVFRIPQADGRGDVLNLFK